MQQIVALGRRALAQREQLCLATVVHVEGSAYRKPGARMLLASGGERAGTISGGCLEAEIARKAWWLTEQGSRVERYSSFADEDGGMPYGLGCGGTISLLLEQGAPAQAVLSALERGIATQQPAVVLTFLGASAESVGAHLGSSGPAPVPEPDGPSSSAHESRSNEIHSVGPGTIAIFIGRSAAHLGAPGTQASAAGNPAVDLLYSRAGQADETLAEWAAIAIREAHSLFLGPDLRPWHADQSGLPAWFVEYLPPPPAISIFGAGDDAQPIAALAHALGWRVSVADGRAHLARRDRFPQAASVRVLDYDEPSLRTACGVSAGSGWLPSAASLDGRLAADDIAVILTHSFEQDRALLAALLPRPMRYLGVLGPRHRTERLLADVAPALGITLEEGFARLHSPIGLDLGAREPVAVALSIVAEVQAVLHNRLVAVSRSPLSLGGSAPHASALLAELSG